MTTAPAATLRVAAVLPALNESASIAAVVHAIAPYARAIVVDDGSNDGTGDIARAAGADVVTHPRNRGYDRALESGLLRAIELGFDAAITLDADGQHDPTLLLRFTEALQNGAQVVCGVRDSHQRWSESLFAVVGGIVWRLHDPLCGMKAYRTDVLKRLCPLFSYESIGTEVALRACRTGFRVAQVPVPTRPRQGASRFGSGLRANLRICRALLKGLVAGRDVAS